MNKGFVEISFAWLFAIIAGAAILALSIFAATKIVNIGQYAGNAETQNQIAVLLNPLETSFQTGQVTSMSISSPTRIYNQCDTVGNFGDQLISTSQNSFGKWSTQSNSAAFQNKYIFSNDIVEGQQFYLFSKPFDLPFKVSDVIYMTSSSENYCFVSPPSSIQDELSKLNEKNILLVNDPSSCAGSTTICFSSGQNCDINVDYNLGFVSKNNTIVAFYSDALMYGAIFSDANVYECQVKRLMERESQLSSLYLAKANTITQIGCSSSLILDLMQMVSLSNSFGKSSDLSNVIPLANKLQQENTITQCPLW